MANMNKQINMLFIKLNRQCKENESYMLNKSTRFSKEFGNTYNRYRLTKWVQFAERNKKGDMKIKNYPTNYDFDKAVDLIKWMVDNV